MTKEELRAANEALGKEIAALRELLTVIGQAALPYPAPDATGAEDAYLRQSRARLMDVTSLARGLMRYAGSPHFPVVAFGTTETLRGIIATPARYQVAAERGPAGGAA